MPWRLRLAEPAEADLREAVAWSRQVFGEAQAARYRLALRATAMAVRQDPFGPLTRGQEALLPGLRSLHMREAGQRGRHVLYYRAEDAGRILVLRVLHDAMDPTRHLPPGPR
ncbi:type II toxin-antitoxin system RelE/ParE family toxin [Siccirubricoccus phaeus]|uniref:type II toxin-antitoxin system RelE/ParE family toxin n=1 Tax=Siccirubricoccus phaeus TaxID=2595053 RepID=UPI0011F15057|nr:type II toxin-antitoxin system RelE/ParE family toxin [Siccirubricoccus phaeus]